MCHVRDSLWRDTLMFVWHCQWHHDFGTFIQWHCELVTFWLIDPWSVIFICHIRDTGDTSSSSTWHLDEFVHDIWWVRDTLQHTATHCNTLQHIATHTATHCNTLHHTATHCNTLHHTATHCSTRTRDQLARTHMSARAMARHWQCDITTSLWHLTSSWHLNPSTRANSQVNSRYVTSWCCDLQRHERSVVMYNMTNVEL